MRILLFTGLLALAALGGCKVATVSSQLPPTSANPFGGAAGTGLVLPVRVARRGDTPPGFGPYRVSELHRGWPSTSTYRKPLRPGATGSPVLDVLNLPYEQLQTTTTGKSQFHFADSLGHAAEVYATTREVTEGVSFTSADGLSQLEQVQKSAVSYSAIIVGPQLGATNAWNLLLSLPTLTRYPADPTATIGLLGDADHILYRLRLTAHPPLPGRNGQLLPWPAAAGPGGIELLRQGQRVGYVDFATAHPVVWLRGDLSPEEQFLAATTFSATLLRTSW